MANGKVFISYRRDTGQELARGLNDRLNQRGIETFFDRDTLHNGKFNQQLLTAIKECSDFVFVFSKGALDRCANEGDWVRTEIETALKERKNIVLVYNYQPLQFPENLPSSLHDLPNYQGIYINHDYYNEGIDRLLNYLEAAKYAKSKRRNRLVIIAIAVILCLIAAIVKLTGGSSTDTTEVQPVDSVAVAENQTVENEILAPGHTTPTTKKTVVESQRQKVVDPAANNAPTVTPSTAGEVEKPAATAPAAQTPVAVVEQPVVNETQQRLSPIEQLESKAKAGDSGAACNLGLMYLDGDGVKKSFKTAFNYFRQSAQAGNADGMYWLGWCYRMGRGTSKDLTLAKQWWTKAAKAGNADAKEGLSELQSLM